jgi:hypothetical protein
MEELLELRHHIQEGRYTDALLIVDELTEMAKRDKINRITTFMGLLMMHIIKQHAEKRTTPSWERTIRNAVLDIRKTNKRDDAGGFYMNEEQLRIGLDEYYRYALMDAASEAFGGQFSHKKLADMIDQDRIKQQALDYMLNGIPDDDE